MRKTIKITGILLSIMMIIMFLTTNVMAADEIIKGMEPSYTDNSGIGTIGGKIVNVISTAGVVVAVIVLLVLGIKYMMGSASEKAEYKKTMIPYLVGAILIFGASAITKVVVALGSGLKV